MDTFFCPIDVQIRGVPLYNTGSIQPMYHSYADYYRRGNGSWCMQASVTGDHYLFNQARTGQSGPAVGSFLPCYVAMCTQQVLLHNISHFATERAIISHVNMYTGRKRWRNNQLPVVSQFQTS
jgi:hypothetical protein